jgi:2-oxoglutarate dehydrogenase E2 component (dihydrolipoamide succinyltransferase)
MAIFEVVMPKLGESIIEATIIRWLKKEGDSVAEDDAIVEIATDKVDSEIPSPVEGKLSKLNFSDGDVVPVGAVIALIEMAGEGAEAVIASTPTETFQSAVEKAEVSGPQEIPDAPQGKPAPGRFYSPLVKNIAKNEHLSFDELNSIEGSGKDGRVTKTDILIYLEDKKSGKAIPSVSILSGKTGTSKVAEPPVVKAGTGDEIIEMDRMRKLIADHMVMSKHTSPHVTMFHEVDLTVIVNWRNKIKDQFQHREGEKLTFTPLFIEAAARALKDFPLVNSSVDGYNIIKRKNINIGMATALPGGNLIVPVIRNADQKNLAGLAKTVNDLANRARNNKLNPDEIQEGTFTITNFGQFGNLTGAPIINQPQVAILGIGTIQKKPVVLETADGDMIAIRHILIMSLAFDHRIVDGALGGMFLQRVGKYLQEFDMNRTV